MRRPSLGFSGSLLLLALGCSKDDGTGLLSLRIIADSAKPPMAAQSLVLNGTPGGVSRTYRGDVRVTADSPVEYQFPGLPATDSPYAFSVYLYRDDGCLVGQSVGAVSATIRAGAKTGPLDVTVTAAATCGDAGADKDAPKAEGDGAADVPVGTGGATGTGGAAGGAGGLGGSLSATGGAGGGSSGSGGKMQTGGDASTGGETGNGGRIGSGGVVESGGTSGRGGSVSSGGVSGSGGVATGGATGSTCQTGATQCSGDSIQTCNGTWGLPAPCGTHQACTGPSGTAKCTCKVDALCVSSAGLCDGTSTLINCAKDEQGCFYQSSSSPCTNGACFVQGGSASCCTNACVLATGNTCLTGTSLGPCSAGANGCTVAGTATACPTGTVCRRSLPATCLDPNWTDWLMPNSAADVAAGAPNPASLLDNKDGTVTDKVTSLMWQQDATTTQYLWPDAVAYCQSLSLAGYKNWRLPAIIELVSLTETSSTAPAMDFTAFPKAGGEICWSSTTVPDMAARAWGFYVIDGTTFFFDTTTYKLSVRCVR